MIKRFIFVMMVAALVILPVYAQQSSADKEIARTQEFIAATTKQGAEKISAMKAYIQKFPETSSKWTVLAHYHLAIEYYNTKDYAQAVQYGEKTLKLGSISDGEEGRLLLVIANSYGVKSASVFNQDKALEYAQRAVTFAESKNLDDVLDQARKLKAQLTPQPTKKLTPEQQVKFDFSNANYSGVISYYQQLSAADKANEEIHKTYAAALQKADKTDQALNEYTALHSKARRAAYATKIAELYMQKGKKNKQFIDNAVDSFLEAHLLYSKEGNANFAKTALDNAKFQLYEKYGLNDKIKRVNASMNNQQDSSKKNEAEISRLEAEIRKEERRLRKEYESQDIEPPDYEKAKIDKLQKKVDALKSGSSSSGSSKSSDEAKKLEDELNKVKRELDDLLAKARKRLGM